MKPKFTVGYLYFSDAFERTWLYAADGETLNEARNALAAEVSEDADFPECLDFFGAEYAETKNTN